MNSRFLKPILSLAGALTITACVSREVTVREPINMSTYKAEGYTATNMVVSDHIRMAAPEGWHFHSKKKEDPAEVRFWIRDKGSNSTHGVVRMNKLDFNPDLKMLAPRYAELAMAKFSEKEARETELDGYPAQIVTGKHEDGSVSRISALVSTNSTNLVEITLASSSNQFLADPSLPYSIINSYKLMPSSLSLRHIQGSFSFRCHDARFWWVTDVAETFMKGGFLVAGPVDDSIVFFDVAQVSTTEFKDLYKMSLFDVPEYSTEVHLAGSTYSARGIGYHAKEKNWTSAKFMFKHQDKNYVLGVAWKSKQYRYMDPKTLHELPVVREALDKYFFFAG